MNISLYLYSLLQKGNIAYEYNPFHNYLTDVDLYEVDTDVGKVLCPKNCAVNRKNGLILKQVEGKYVDSKGNVITDYVTSEKKYATAGSLIDFDTDKLNFDLEHPVDITIQPSYDGSVNLILNDDKNIPRIINSRFSVREKNTYEIVDRIGENDTNIYNSRTFDKDTSLYFLYLYNPKVLYLGFISGVLPVGEYCFYFTYCDADNNESDYISESGIIPTFIGQDGDPNSIDGGIKNLSSNKGIKLKLTNLDKSYNYLKVYYVRYFADYLQNTVFECKKIYKRYPINSGTIYLQITGTEECEDLDPNILNISRFNPKHVLTQAQCKNMLFFGNIVKNSDNYKELTDCALRISPSVVEQNYEEIDNNYDGNNNYYNSKIIYNNTGYFRNEFYRFGVVFIYQNGTLSNVYNTLGGDLSEPIGISESLYNVQTPLLVRNYIKIDENGWIKSSSAEGEYLNAKGVCYIPNNPGKGKIYGIKFNISLDVIDLLKSLGIRGMFFVRQKRVPILLAQCYLLNMDDELLAPVIKYSDDGDKYVTECFVSNETGEVTNLYENRLYKYEKVGSSEDSISKQAYAGICPDFLINLPYFNQIFNGGSFRILKATTSSELLKDGRFYTENKGYSYEYKTTSPVKICTVTEDVPTVAIEDKIYRLEIGETEEAFRFKYAEIDNGSYDAGDDNYDLVNESYNIVRGKYSPYLAIYSKSELETGCLYNIYLNSSLNSTQEYQNRMDSSEPFYAISDRYNFEEITNNTLTCWRGDCYHNQITYRLNRNFNDPSLPNNDEIIDKNTWKDNYKIQEPENWTNISRSDINAVQMGSWITFSFLSTYNFALRSIDHSYVSEEALMGAPRSFYPRSKLLFRGENKMPDSYLYNDAYRNTLGYKCYFTLLDINYVKDTFSNRILYSAISILDSFKNNYRYSLSTYFRDYSQEYGGIMKLVGFEGYLLVVFEHAIGVAVVNERVLAGTGDGEPVFINTNNVLPEELTIISDTYGTQWSESVIKTESGNVYGVDTVLKKIWRVKGQLIEILSDFKVNKFLIDNISLGERELEPIVGLKNVKTHYNNNKKDVMFTFYDDLYKDEEKVWNLCYNELLGEFVTFYSWVPSYSENIDTTFFSFNRQTSKLLGLLNKCNYSIPDNTGVLLDIPMLIDNKATLHYVVPLVPNITYTNSQDELINPIQFTDRFSNKELSNISFSPEKDHWGNYKYFNISGNTLELAEEVDEKTLAAQKGVLLLYITPKIGTESDLIIITETKTYFKTEVIAVTTKDWLETYCTQDFYLHGRAGIFDIKEDIFPCHWYDEYHPFEFEFVVNDKIAQLKIFNDLVIISNKAEPESFHFEIEGDNYEFSNDKRTMYFRLEATKNLYLNLGSNILYNRKYTDVIATKRSLELYYRGTGTQENSNLAKCTPYDYSGKPVDKVYPVENTGLVRQVKSTIFPLYYERIDTYNEIYDLYTQMTGTGYDFKNLSGSEIKWNDDLNLFNIVTHIKNSPIDLYGRLRGNSRYKEGKWDIQIPSITFMLKNEGEEDWIDVPINLEDGPLKNKSIKIPPIVVNSSNLPPDLTDTDVSRSKLPSIYLNNEYNWPRSIDNNDWTYRKETRIRDKWIKIRIRYSGKNLAVIHSLITLYNISYA